jgi:tripartite-type tricarboxylate transporter receptor subunit TctC
LKTVSRFSLVLLACFAAGAHAQSYPSRPVRLVVPYVPGGGTDVMARRIAQELTPKLGQTVVVENIGGAGGSLGMRQVAQAAPDGYTLILALTSQWAVNVSVFPKLPYDPVKDFDPITTVAVAPYVLVVHPSLPATTVAGLIALAKKMPGKLSYGSAGNGSGQHLGIELLKSMAHIDMQHVPYKGGAPAMVDAISGMVPVTLQTYTSTIGPVKSGRLRALGVTTPQRSPVLPDVPSISETVPGYRSEVWYLIGAPAGTPKEIVSRLNGDIVHVLRAPAMRRTLESDANVVIASSPAEARDFIRSEIAKWAKVVKSAGVRID